MDVAAVILSFLGPPLIGGYLLRKGGCGWGRTLFGALMCFAIAWVPLFFLFRMAERNGWDMDIVVLFLPIIELAVFAYLVTNDWRKRA